MSYSFGLLNQWYESLGFSIVYRIRSLQRQSKVVFSSLIAVISGLMLQATVVAQDVIVDSDVTYGKINNTELKLDLARPASETMNRPAIVFIHGGAWAGGSRESYKGWIKRAATKGYVAATISYRLTGAAAATSEEMTPFPAQIQDCNCAVRWLRSMANRYSIDAERIGVAGGSAGGHLSLLVGMAKIKEFEGSGGSEIYSSQVKAIVNFCGPTDLASEYKDISAVQPFLEALCQGSPETAFETYKNASPITYVSKTNPPILTLHGDSDDIVPVGQAKLLDKMLNRIGVEHEMTIFNGAGHDFKGLTDGKKDVADAAEDLMWKFFAKHLMR